MRTTDYVEYMVLPRMLALSEVVWSPAELRDWDGFTRRLPAHLGRLGTRSYNFRIPDVLGLEQDRLTLEEGTEVALRAPAEGGAILYTLDGPDPGAGAGVLDGLLHLPLDEDGVELAARIQLPDGRTGAVRRARFARASLARPVSFTWSRRIQGLGVEGFQGRFSSVEAVGGGQPSDLGGSLTEAGHRVPRVTLPDPAPSGRFGLRLTGYIKVPRPGIYTFFLSSDDGSRLTVADRLVVDHDGPHSMSEKSGQVALHRGWHPIQVTYFQGGGGQGMRLEVEGPGFPRREVPAGWFAHLRAP
jgi:hexosaminidase